MIKLERGTSNKILIVVENEVGHDQSFMDSMLIDAGISPSEVTVAYFLSKFPPKGDLTNWIQKSKTKAAKLGLGDFHANRFTNSDIALRLQWLTALVQQVKPNLVVTFGNGPLWALTGQWGITSWRSSLMKALPQYGDVKVIPTYSPSMVMRQYDLRYFAVHDLRRCVRESQFPELITPNYNFIIRPSYADVMNTLAMLQKRAEAGRLRLSVDLETRSNLIACTGIAWSDVDAICIPQMCVERANGYWNNDEYFSIVVAIRKLLQHPNVETVGQNFLYDEQYICRYWGFRPHKVIMDTMIGHQVCWPGLPKGLDFLSSLYCKNHIYWKDDGKLWDPKVTSEDQLWVYNCTDAVRTWEISHALDTCITGLKLEEQFKWQMRTYELFLRVMLRGVDVDRNFRSDIVMELLGHAAERKAAIQKLSGRDLNPNSPKQMSEFFYDALRLPEQINRKSGTRTCDEDALLVLAKKEPLVEKLIYCITESRQIANSLSTVQTPLDVDGKMRCSYNVAGTETFRLSSSENAFYTGTNLQNITSGKKSEKTGLQLPNLRRLFVPPPGQLIVDVDLDRADLQVVVWEADDRDLKDKLRAKVDLHIENAKDIFRVREVTKVQRQVAKVFVHATNYGGFPRTVAMHCGITIRECEEMQNRWFQAHPGIKAWQKRTEAQLAATRQVRNAFGYRRYYFDRIEGLLGQALAWVPQSTVGLVINRGAIAMEDNCPEAEIRLQVHDSLTFTISSYRYEETLARIRPHLEIVIPYPDPLVIPVGFAVSTKSWGDVKEIAI